MDAEVACVHLEWRQLVRGRVGSEVRGAGRQARRRIRANREGRVGHHAPLNVGDAPLGASLVWVEVKVWGGLGMGVELRGGHCGGVGGGDLGGSQRKGEVRVVWVMWNKKATSRRLGLCVMGRGGQG